MPLSKRPISNDKLLANAGNASKRSNHRSDSFHETMGSQKSQPCDPAPFTTKNHHCGESGEVHEIEPDDDDTLSAEGTMPRNTTGISNKTSSTLSSNAGLEDEERGSMLMISSSQEFAVNKSDNLSVDTTTKDFQSVTGRLGLVVDDIPLVMRQHSLDTEVVSNLGVRGGLRLTSEPLTYGDRRLSSSYPQRRGSALSRESSGGRTENTSGVSAGNWGWFEDVHNDAGSRNSPKHSSYDKEGDYGNFDDDEEEQPVRPKERQSGRGLLQFTASTVQPLDDIGAEAVAQETTMAVSAPTYVLEESISSQKLWRKTAGNRPPQPIEERAYFEDIWAQNFLQSQVNYQAPLEVLVAASPISMSPYADVGFTDTNDVIQNYNTVACYHNPTVFGGAGGDWKRTNKNIEVAAAEVTIANRSNNSNSMKHSERKIKSGEGTLSVLIKGDNIFGTTVSKSFARADRSGRIDTISISIASYRVVQSKKFGKYAQYLVVYREGSFQNTVGVWKRYSDFDSLARKVTGGQESCSSLLAQITPFAVHDDLDDNEVDKEILPNAVTSWRLLKKRQRWFRCLDAGYLSLKVFLLERFLHDILFETSNPQILRDFIGVDFLQ